jgi:diguanylate cyclase (GGDEF)-like protein
VLRFGVVFAVVGALTTAAGVGLAWTHAVQARAALDRSMTMTAGEKAVLVSTELERVSALAKLTARIPPFSELYADEGSLAAAIAAVAGPAREVDEALSYLCALYPDRIVEAGYVDISGRENARIVRGWPLARSTLGAVRSWPSFAAGAQGRVGEASLSGPFASVAGADVVAATSPVAVDGRTRAYVEVQLDTAALVRVLAGDREPGTSVALVKDGTVTVALAGPGTALPAFGGEGLYEAQGRRVAVRAVPGVPGARWYIAASAPSPGMLALLFAPAPVIVTSAGLLLLALAWREIRRRRIVQARALVTEQQARREAEHRALVDGLTGLYNRRHAMQTLEHELDRAGRDGGRIGLLVFDIDHFKAVNDTYRHIGGDAVLVEVARRLQSGVRRWDVVARLGGEEFCVIAPNVVDEDEVARLGERLRLLVGERPVGVDGAEVTVTVSVGAAVVVDAEGSAEGALDLADHALYAAKRGGRNQLRRYSELTPGR